MTSEWHRAPERCNTPIVAKQTGRLQRGELESLIMDVLWDRDQWLTPGDVHEITHRRHPLAYTTVMTIMARLWKKGMLDRRQEGRAFAYHPISTRDEWAAQQMGESLAAAGDPAAALGHFVSTMNTKNRDQLRRALNRRRVQ